MTRRRPALAAVVLLTFVLAGCGGGDHERSHSASAATATPPAATAFGGDCGLVLRISEVSMLIGPAQPADPVAGDDVVSPRPGSLVCAWRAASGGLTVTAVPASEVSAHDLDRYSLPECSPDTGFCGGSATAGGMWMLVDYGWIEGEWEPTVSTALSAVMRSAVAHPLP